jgi:hypothetical protein
VEWDVSFTDEERRRWHEEKRRREERPLSAYRGTPVATCVHCQNDFGLSEGKITAEFAICDICNGD